ncbi:MAG: hypothetical protein IPF44_11245 [Betaproteobacteria bacterium]|nr:hypothetical protein [Betaproteobacteria bacterium]
MISLTTTLSQSFAPANLPAAVRAALGKPLRRAAPLTQLALVGALACLPAERRTLPTTLLWQSTSGPRLETLTLLEEVCGGSAEPMPYDFLATQPAIAAAQIQSFLPGLQTAMHLPLDSEGSAKLVAAAQPRHHLARRRPLRPGALRPARPHERCRERTLAGFEQRAS